MTQNRKDKIWFGSLLAIWFGLWAVVTYLEPNRAINDDLASYGLHTMVLVVGFASASFLAIIHMLFNWRWNVVVLLPYILHTTALVAVKLDSGNAPSEAIILRLVLLILLLKEFHRDYDTWKTLK